MKNYENYIPKNAWEKDVLDYDQFEGDFGSQDDATFKNRMVKSRGTYTCTYCLETIFPKELYRYEVKLFDGELMTYKTCRECCKGMARWWDDDGKSLTERDDIRRLNLHRL